MEPRAIVIGIFCVSTGSAFGMHSSRSFINADDVHGLGITGLGVTVAVIDTGIYGHPGLAGSIAPGGVSIINGVENEDGGIDIWPALSEDHGTYMSLIITDGWGVAPSARILPVRVFHVYDFGQGPVYTALTEDIVQAIDYVRLCQDDDPSIRVINLSLGELRPPEQPGGPLRGYPCPCDEWNVAYEQTGKRNRKKGQKPFTSVSWRW